MPITVTDLARTFTANNVKDLAELITPVLARKGRDLKELGGRLGAMIKPGSPLVTFTNLDELADHLISTYDMGKNRQAAGDDLEALAAAHIGGSVAQGNTIPEWALNFVKNNGDNADPDLYAEEGRKGATLKPDVWSDDAVGICGGAAKANNIPKLSGICDQLVKVCAAHGKTPLVFCTADTPQTVFDAAKGYVGDDGVLILQADKSWKTLNSV